MFLKNGQLRLKDRETAAGHYVTDSRVPASTRSPYEYLLSIQRVYEAGTTLSLRSISGIVSRAIESSGSIEALSLL